MQKAMQAVLDFPQKASKSHCEAWYGFFTTYSEGKYFRDNKTISKADKQFRTILQTILDMVKMEPFDYKYRIQNESALIGIITDRYQLFNDINDLEKAIHLNSF